MLLQYDYDNNQFGHPYGDRQAWWRQDHPASGRRPYKFVKV